MEDTNRYNEQRKLLVEQIRRKGISDQAVLDAIGRVARHAFMDNRYLDYSYRDNAFPISAGQTISQPFTVAFQTQLLAVKPNEKALEIGTGSGYQAAILAEMGADVYTIERQYTLYVQSKELLGQSGYKIRFFYDDGNDGLPEFAPFDKILVTAAATEIPETLVQQLKTGGRMVIPVGGEGGQEMTLVVKKSDTEIAITYHGGFIFVPFLKGKA
jgi:protein-L-isoaspartate(D-aspartate) O-methyltransferase